MPDLDVGLFTLIAHLLLSPRSKHLLPRRLPQLLLSLHPTFLEFRPEASSYVDFTLHELLTDWLRVLKPPSWTGLVSIKYISVYLYSAIPAADIWDRLESRLVNVKRSWNHSHLERLDRIDKRTDEEYGHDESPFHQACMMDHAVDADVSLVMRKDQELECREYFKWRGSELIFREGKE
jgi:hypothetical protein